ncbi:MAG TPA: S-methyl-5'-thioadenosine phosphorylase [Thermoplasmataceae archaeon]|nr:S-methyl-5'-thioadenosine phosphorylase [Thermoplasmatales archaeon AK]HLH85704.1 S-methyl-5'-thioadenosine phosphorylase [Thermoplasmataceae archaeon]
MAYIGIIGGSGIYSLMKDVKSVDAGNKYGEPSAPIEIGKIAGKEVAFIARHGKKHQIPPHRVNYRANIWALKELGVERVIGVNAVGSLKSELPPGSTVIPDQFLDFTKRRDLTFYDGPEVYHISTADPFCPEMNKILFDSAQAIKGNRAFLGGTYVTIEGPRFSTRAESKMFRQFADIIGMTLVPEVNLADELGMCYSVLATVTDYDVWSEAPVDASEVFKIMKENEEKVSSIITESVRKISEKRHCSCSKRLEGAKA